MDAEAASQQQQQHAREQRFLQWLADNGAVFPKLQWPATTATGSRGVIALADIATNEPMLQVPAKLMISEQLCWQDPQLERVFEANRDVFRRDDPVLALFVMRELLRGDASFFAPYLAILPYPESIQDWTDDELRDLHDRRLVDAAKRRRSEIDTFYDSVFTALDASHPGEFPRAQYTHERFAFAWKTIQARTFGRRLPWTALVPFADCLNHANVATKYDFDSDNSGHFRLFPSASTKYEAGAEVFNSYGRRSNSELLLDYGFALCDNEWDTVAIDVPKDVAIDCTGSIRWRLLLDRQSVLRELWPHVAGRTESPAALHAGYSALRGVLVAALEGFGCSIADAEAQLQPCNNDAAAMSSRRRNALVYCLSRMRVIARVIAQIDVALVAIARTAPSADSRGSADSCGSAAVSATDAAAVGDATSALGRLSLASRTTE